MRICAARHLSSNWSLGKAKLDGVVKLINSFCVESGHVDVNRADGLRPVANKNGVSLAGMR